ncbi:MAG: membrane protein insertase YidC [Spirochaetaceae bacterium]|jgi:YidC/Oxa1 family membrane protein insertase|nr:membrane protein insertase YidC [Spirochaetaceae bacterium]
MEKKTILAIVLSIVVMVIYAAVMQKFYPAKPAGTKPVVEQLVQEAGVTDSNKTQVESNTAVQSIAANTMDEPAEFEEFVTISTNYIDTTLTNFGGDMVSFKLKEHKDGQDYVDMIFAGENDPHAFSIAFGGKNMPYIKSPFHIRRISDYQVEFYRDFSLEENEYFTLRKKYTFVPNEYMFELDITIDGGAAVPKLNFNSEVGSSAYTLAFGPQLGPKFEALDERQDYRHYFTYINGKRKDSKVNANQDALVNTSISWAAIAGKYFTLIACPDATRYSYIFSTKPDEAGVPSASRLFIERPPLTSSTQTDVFRFYLGPKTSQALDVYDTNRSYWKDLSELRLSDAASTGGFWSILNPLEFILKKLLTLFYKLIPNYGVAIILVTLLVKLLLFPITKKGSEGTLRMQAIAPKIKELQEKYKDNPAKLNVEMAALYKKEGYNPVSGCLPMLIQIPIFFAMYNLFNNHFDLRGAIFISGWIPDLSLPESVYNFAPAKIPLLGWSDIRILPFIYVGSQLLYGKVTQTPDQQGNTQMKFMLYAMPVIFFFVLYNVPAGLLVYWIMSNILTMIQQVAINKYLAKKKAAHKDTEESVHKIIAPPKKKKRR